VPKHSAGLLVYRLRGPGAQIEVLLVHPGGPYWARRDDGWWSLPKGEVDGEEDELEAAEREFEEELGSPAPPGPRTHLGEVTQTGGKRVRAWALEGEVDVSEIDGGTFELEWPPRSGVVRRFPEIDRAGWFGLEEARTKLLQAQVPLLDRLVGALAAAPPPRPVDDAG
jgi:predicted NUDIX family NTP pyrophosphohydrolase